MGTSTIKSSGGDYTSLSAWEAAKNGNIIGLGPEIAECYDLDDTTDVAISGWATSASDYIEIKAVTAARCNGSTRAQTGNTYRLSSSSTSGVLRNSQSHVRISGIEIKCTTGGIAFQQVSAASGSDVRVEDCVLSSNDASASTSYTVYVTTSALNLQLTNCIITGKRRGMDCRSAYTVAVNHCTWFTDAADLGIVADTELTCTNTYVGGFTTQCFWTGGAAPSGSNNAGSDTSVTTDYTSSLASKAAADQFTNPSISDSTMDFTLKATADLVDAGTGSFATDIAGNTRSGTVDIGAFEYISGGGTTTYTVTGSLAAVLQKQGLTKTATLNAILKKQGLTLSSSIDAMLLKVVALTSDVDAILQKQDVTKAATLAAVLQKQGVTGATTMSAVLQNQGVGVSSVLDAVLQANPTISADLSALLQKTISLTGVIDAILQKTVTAGASLDAILTSVGSGLTSATLDAILRKTAALSGTLDALLQRQGITATATLNALLLKQQTRTATLNAILFGSASIAVALDALLKKTGATITASLGAILTVSGAFVAPKNLRYVMGDDRIIEIAADDRIIEVD